MEEIRQQRAGATGAMKDVLQGEVLPPEETTTPKKLVDARYEANWKQRGEADPKLLAAIGLTAAGALGGAYLAGDEKVAGAVLGGVAAAGAMRLPATLGALGKTLSYRTATGNALRIGAVLGAGTDLGGKEGNPVEGAAIAASILPGAGGP